MWMQKDYAPFVSNGKNTKNQGTRRNAGLK
jgi:hypothetical protein